MKLCLSVLFALAASATPAAAHGAVFPLPWHGPGDTNRPGPAPSGGGPAPAPPGPSSPGPAGAGGRPAPGGAGASSPGSLGDGVDLGEWTWWWEFNKEPFLDVKAHVHAAPVVSGDQGFYLGRGHRAQAARGTTRPSEAQIKGQVVPALLAALREGSSNDVTTAALIALAKVGSERSGLPAGTLSRELAQSLKDKNQEVSETAAAALGILGDDPSALLLSELLIDSEQGRDATGRREVGVRTRSFAAYGLAVLGNRTANVDVRRYIVHELDQALAADDTPGADFGTACVIALGRIFLDWRGPSDSAGEKESEDALPAASSREGQIQALLAVLRDDDRDRIVRAHAPVSLAALLARDSDGAPPALRDEVTKELTLRLGARKRESRELQQSCVIALGLYGDNDDDATDRAIRELLRDVAARVGDRQLRNFALISLARVGARNGSAAAPPVDDTVEYLLERLGRGNDTGQWAALALGVFARQLAASGRIPNADINVSLREKLRGSSTPLDVGALAIATGLARDLAAQEPLLEKLAKVDEERARGHAAIALGLLDSEEALDPIREILDDATYRPTLLRELAIALGLLGDPNVARELVAKLEEAQSLAAQASIAQALGRIGVAESVAPLVALLASEERSERARAFAAVALGILIDKDDLPWNAVLSVNTNYVAAPPTLYDGQGFGILNIL